MTSSPREGSPVFAHLRRARLKTVGTHFLRLRPLVAVTAGAANSALLLASDTSAETRLAVALCMGSLTALFVGEALFFRTREASEGWLVTSLALTAIVLTAACAASGGLTSPLVPLILVPIVVGFAAFGRAPESLALGLLGACLFAALVPASGDAPPIDPLHRHAMSLVTMLAALALARIGVAELAESYVETGRALDRLRLEVLDESLRRARDAEALGQRVAHEIKNPLTSIKGLAQLVREGLDDERQKKRLEVLLAEVERVDALAHGYLSLARPLGDLSLEEVDLGALRDDVLALLEARAREARVELRSEGDAHATLTADPRRLREALLNLAENGIRAMKDGGALSVRVESTPATLRLLVEDEGPSLDDAALAALAERYESRTGGTGLGVAIARSAARQHGGSLAFERRGGRGLRAIVTLPRSPGSPSS